ncbi:hypothetical protein D3C84_1123950 [compost metagenome]
MASWLENRKVARQTSTMPFRGWSMRCGKWLWALMERSGRSARESQVVHETSSSAGTFRTEPR